MFYLNNVYGTPATLTSECVRYMFQLCDLLPQDRLYGLWLKHIYLCQYVQESVRVIIVTQLSVVI